MAKILTALRGAVCVENTVESITENICLMCRELFTRNNIKAEDIVSLQFTWLAIFADVGVMVLAVLNAIRAMFTKNLRV